MVFRVDVGFEPTRLGHKFDDIRLGIAFSDDGITWSVQPRTLLDELRSDENLWVYDPRLTVLDERCCCLSFCMDTRHGMRAGLALTDDFVTFDVVTLSLPDLRNVVVFPERVGGDYVRLERPFPIYLRRVWGQVDRFDIWMSRSPDLRHWGESQLLVAVEQVPYATEKIGPGPPPLRTDAGWLAFIHAVDTDPARSPIGWERTWAKRYTAGVMLLDADDPGRVIGVSQEPVLVPDAPYERTDGFRPDVVFPTGAVLEDDATVKLYYGAADTVICLAHGHLDALIDLVGPLTRPQPHELAEREAQVPKPEPATE
jgi:beta-1,4-mannooligosaccharide/beta-1,4-mannosyl-N-acetylglucosamine phosphorylase